MGCGRKTKMVANNPEAVILTGNRAIFEE